MRRCRRVDAEFATTRAVRLESLRHGHHELFGTVAVDVSQGHDALPELLLVAASQFEDDVMRGPAIQGQHSSIPGESDQSRIPFRLADEDIRRAIVVDVGEGHPGHGEHRDVRADERHRRRARRESPDVDAHAGRNGTGGDVGEGILRNPVAGEVGSPMHARIEQLDASVELSVLDRVQDVVRASGADSCHGMRGAGRSVRDEVVVHFIVVHVSRGPVLTRVLRRGAGHRWCDTAASDQDRVGAARPGGESLRQLGLDDEYGQAVA